MNQKMSLLGVLKVNLFILFQLLIIYSFVKLIKPNLLNYIFGIVVIGSIISKINQLYYKQSNFYFIKNKVISFIVSALSIIPFSFLLVWIIMNLQGLNIFFQIYICLILVSINIPILVLPDLTGDDEE